MTLMDVLRPPARLICCPSESRYLSAPRSADVVLGMIPFARELLRRGTDVVLVANSLPALNDITAGELQVVLQEAARVDETLRASLAAAAESPGTPTNQARERTPERTARRPPKAPPSHPEHILVTV